MARSVKGLVLGVLASGGLVVACNAISGLDEDFQLGGGGTLPADGGNDTGSSSGDGATDGSMADAQPDAGPFRCPAQLAANQLFCDDFEVDNAWTRTEIMPAGSPLEVQSGIGVGGSGGLRAHANVSSNSRKVVRWKTVTGTFPDNSSIRLRFKFKLEAAGLNYFVLGAIQVNDQPGVTNAEYGLATYKNCPGAASTCLDENNPQGEGNHTFADQIGYQVDRWYDASVTVKRTGGSYTGTITVDGTHAIDTDGPTYFSGNPTKVEIGVGVFYTGNDPGLQGGATLDDVLVERL